jgi:hypothetical protein
MMATLATSQNPQKTPWVHHVNDVEGGHKAALEDMFCW